MSDIDQGGFVYPAGQKVLGYDDILPAHPGITLRQHYAGLAMQAICAQHDVKDWAAMEMIAAMSYAMADAMIEAGKQ